MDSTNLYGHCKTQLSPYDKTEMCHGHPDPYMKKSEAI